MMEIVKMSATIYWQPRETRDHSLRVGAPSHFIEVMTKVFGDYPWQLRAEHMSALRGMSALNDDGAGNPYTEMLDALGEHTAITVYPEY